MNLGETSGVGRFEGAVGEVLFIVVCRESLHCCAQYSAWREQRAGLPHAHTQRHKPTHVAMDYSEMNAATPVVIDNVGCSMLHCFLRCDLCLPQPESALRRESSWFHQCRSVTLSTIAFAASSQLCRPPRWFRGLAC